MRDHPVGMPERYVLEQPDLFAKQVMPVFKARSRVPPSAGRGG